jgi:hypothetical protein
MADARLILSDLLCFLFSKFGKTDVKQIRIILMEYYSAADITTAKKQLVDDVLKLEITETLPYTPQRRDGENRVKLEIDDIFTLINFLDERKMLNNLPKYVTSCPDAIPSIRLFEGDLSFVMARLDRIEERLGFRLNSMTSSMAAIVGQVSAINNDTNSRLNKVAWPKPQAANSTVAKPATTITSVIDKVNRPITTTGKPTTDIIVDMPPSNRNWASDTSTPVAKSRQYNVYSDSDQQVESIDEQMYTEVQSMKKRRRMLSRQSAVKDLVSLTDSKKDSTSGSRRSTSHQPVQVRKSGALVIGKATTDTRFGGIKAAKQSAHTSVQKSVFCIDNIDPSCTVTDLCEYVKAMSVRVLTCYSVKSRHRRSDVEGEAINRQAFRLCIPSEDCSLLLDAEQWPKHIFISEWFFKTAEPTVPVKIGVSHKLAKMRLASSYSDVTSVPNSAQLSSRGSNSELPKESHHSIEDDVTLKDVQSPIVGRHQRLTSVEVHQPEHQSEVTEALVLVQPVSSVDDVIDMDADATILTQDVIQHDTVKLNDGGKK